ncbi:MAG: TlpA family protein disulfide reductase [Verrucomicrobia bacterium]|nr:TlpA family protein disulfide reductase [Verrucomicrobiota bacterium]
MKRIVVLFFSLAILLGLMVMLLRTGSSPLAKGSDVDLPQLSYLDQPPQLKGKAVLIDFWATWCVPCRKSIPHLNGIFDRHGTENLQVIGVTDEDATTVRRFEANTPIKYAVAVTAPKSMFERFAVTTLPQAYLLSPQGKVVWSGHPGELTDLQLETALRHE